jgi:hypothetical protein
MSTAVGAAPNQAALPPPDALATVISTLADPSIPAEQKVALVQYGTVDDEPTLKNFGEALRDSGFVPATVKAADLEWSTTPGDVAASITITSPDDAVAPFTYPMEFTPGRDTWQLARRTADQLLPLVAPSVTTPTPSPPR